MTHETDFLDLYRRLGLHPGCDMDELKRAYRRHVAALHPDRQQGRPADPRLASRLQRLTAQYGAAMEFHRRHGRLPGAPASGAASHGSTPSAGATKLSGVVREAHDPFASRRAAAPAFSPADSTPSHRKPHGKLVVLLVIAALGTLAWGVHEASVSSSSDTTDDVNASAGSGSVEQDASRDALILHMGMSAADVRAVEGEPLAMHGDLWEYGPSWVRFEHDEVVEWHSSPLRPLHTGASAATALSR